MRTEGFGKLHRKQTDSAGSYVNEDSLAGAELAMGGEPLPRGERSDGDGGGLLVGERVWFVGDGGGGGDTELGECAFLIPVVHAKDGLADFDVFDAVAAGADISGEFVGGDGVLARGAVGV